MGRICFWDDPFDEHEASRFTRLQVWIDPAMNLSEYLKPALGVAFFVALGGGWYWFEHRSHAEEKETPGQALVIVTKSTNACFSDMVRVTGFIVPRREAQVGVDQEGSKVTDLFVREGDMVTDNQELARLTAPPQQQQAVRAAAGPGPVSLRAPAAGLVTEVRTAVGAPASPQAGPMFRISINNEIELDAEVPSVHLLKLNPGATVRISRDDAPDRRRQGPPDLAADRPHHPARPCPDIADQQSLAQGRHVRPRQYRRQAQLRRRRSAHRDRPPDRAGGQGQHGRDAKVRVGLTSDTSTEILEGLDVGEIVVADAGTSLHDGDQIKTMFADELERTRTR